jgi:hypothetical protein
MKQRKHRRKTADIYWRSAQNWFLDAATYVVDGETKLAIHAAKSGIAAAKARDKRWR